MGTANRTAVDETIKQIMQMLSLPISLHFSHFLIITIISIWKDLRSNLHWSVAKCFKNLFLDIYWEVNIILTVAEDGTLLRNSTTTLMFPTVNIFAIFWKNKLRYEARLSTYDNGLTIRDYPRLLFQRTS